MRRKVWALLVTFLAVLFLSQGSASAHSALIDTSPADGKVLAQSPPEVTLTYAESVGVGLGSIKVLSLAGKRVDTGAVTQTDQATKVHVALQPNLAQGSYLVAWRVVSADSHPVSGTFSFSVGAPTANAAGLMGRGNLTTLTAAPKGPSILLGTTRFLGFSALVVLLGGGLFGLILWPQGATKLRRALLGAAAIEGIAAALAVCLQGPYASGLGLSHTFDPRLVREVLKLQYGQATLLRVLLALLAAGLILVIRRKGRALAAGLTVLGTLMAATWAAAGHAGAQEGQPYSYLFDLVHLISVSGWVGGLVVLSLSMNKHWSEELRARILPRWSKLAAGWVALLVLTGIAASIREVGDASALFTTRYGVLLVLKDALVAAMLLVALVSRAAVQARYGRRTGQKAAENAEEARTETHEVANSLRRSVGIEAGLALIVLVVTALLVNSVPAKAAFAPPYQGKSKAGPLTVAVDIYPDHRGINGLHVYTVGKEGKTQDVAEVTGEITHGNSEKLTIHLHHKSLGHYEDLGLILPEKGLWTISLQIRVSDTDSYATTQRFVVR